MSGEFEKGDAALMVDGERTYLVKLRDDMARIKGARGAVSTDKIIGKRPGDEVRIGRRSFKLFRPDIMDVLENLERGPQLITPKDSARIVSNLSLKNGSRVVEGGAGSGGMTIMILNSIWKEGELTTYDIREDHLKLAGKNVGMTGMDSIWEGRIGDIRKGVDEDELDGFMIDIPDPENSVGTAWSALVNGGRFAAYVPTVNQMERLFSSLNEAGFSRIKAEEILLREYSLKKGAMRPATEMMGHTGFMIYARKME